MKLVGALEHDFSTTMSRLFAYCHTPPKHIAIALSGGADSMALTMLMQRYQRDYNGHITALTVDHQVRPESGREAKQVGRWMQEQGIAHHILTLQWNEHDKKSSATLRDRRYALLQQWCEQNHHEALLTAHHADDVQETLMMRLWRGAGVEGLAGIPEFRESGGLAILRPLLRHPKTLLLEYLCMRGIAWVEDPSNASDDYERNRIRKLLQEFPLPRKQSDAFIGMMATAAEHLALKRAEWISQYVHYYPDGTAHIFLENPPEQNAFFSVMSEIIMQLSGLTKPPRGYELDNLLAHIIKGIDKRYTVAGLVFEPVDKHCYLVYREPERIESVSLRDTMRWDKRFDISYNAANASMPLTIKPLGTEGLSALNAKRVKFPTHLKYAAKLGLLSIWHLDQCHAVPHIDYWSNTARDCSLPTQLTIVPAVFQQRKKYSPTILHKET